MNKTDIVLHQLEQRLEHVNNIVQSVKHSRDIAAQAHFAKTSMSYDGVLQSVLTATIGLSKYCPKQTEYVYVLLLQGGNYYVGMTSDLEQRLYNHFSGTGSVWTRRFAPVCLVELHTGSASLERELTLKYMSRWGWQRVRGSSWTRLDMSGPPQCLKEESAVTSRFFGSDLLVVENDEPDLIE